MPAPHGEDDEGAGGCCVTIDFSVEMAPDIAAAKLPPLPFVSCWAPPMAAAQARVFEAPRPFCFDRGPPRVDARTALRATQVLLI